MAWRSGTSWMLTLCTWWAWACLAWPVRAQDPASPGVEAEETVPLSLDPTFCQEISARLDRETQGPAEAEAETLPLGQAARLLNATREPLGEASDEENVNRLSARRSAGDLGLHLTGSWQYNQDTESGDDEDIPYLWRTQAGIDWDLLGEGLAENRGKAGAQQAAGKVLASQRIRLARLKSYPHLRRDVWLHFGRALRRLQEEKRDFLERCLQAEKHSYLLGRSYLDSAIRLELEKRRAENALAGLSLPDVRENPGPPDAETWSQSPAEKLPIVDVDIQALARAVNDPAQAREALAALDQAVDARYRYRDEIRLRPFVRYNVTDTGDGVRKDYFSAGVSLSLPVPFRDRSGSELRAAEKELAGHTWRQQGQDRQHEVLGDYGEYRSALGDLFQTDYQILLVRERLRKLAVRRDAGDPGYSPLEALAPLRDLLDLKIDRMETKEKLYLKLAAMFRHLNAEDAAPYLRPAAGGAGEVQTRFRPGPRWVYLWTEAFAAQDNAVLLHLLRARNIGGVLLSFSRQTPPDKLQAFLEAARAARIQVLAMIGEPSYIRPERRDALAEKIKAAFRFPFDGLHLDVEPHTVPELSADPAQMKEQYLDMLRRVASLVKGSGRSLSVSVPPAWGREFLAGAAAIAQRVFLMAYGVTQPDRLADKLNEVLPPGPRDSFVLALRIGDFPDDGTMEALAGRVAGETALEGLAFHHLGLWLSKEETLAPAQ